MRALAHDFEVDRDASNGPVCYCHGDRHDEGWVVTHRNASGSGCEYAYVFDMDEDEVPTLSVYSSYCNPTGKLSGKKMIGAFGMGDKKGVWVKIYQVDLNSKVSTELWKRIQSKAKQNINHEVVK